jgi:hypothetical protein
MAAPMAEVLCPRCQGSVPADAQFCDHCGQSLVAPICRACGTENRIGARFCSKCGRPVDQPGSPAILSTVLAAAAEMRVNAQFCPTCGQPLHRTAARGATPAPRRTLPRIPESTDTTQAPPGADLTGAQVPVAEAPDSAATADDVRGPETPVVAAPGSPVPEQEPEPPSREYHLVIVNRDGTTAGALSLNQGDNLIGLKIPGGKISPDVDLTPFNDRQLVSRRHAIIRVEGDRLLLRDCGSTNGTRVDGIEVGPSPIGINEDSEIRIANLRCRIRT